MNTLPLGFQPPLFSMGVNITTIVYLRVLIIQIGSTIILMVVEVQGCNNQSTTYSRWWLNQPIWKICSSNWIISPGRGEKKTYLKPPPSITNNALLGQSTQIPATFASNLMTTVKEGKMESEWGEDVFWIIQELTFSSFQSHPWWITRKNPIELLRFANLRWFFQKVINITQHILSVEIVIKFQLWMSVWW